MPEWLVTVIVAALSGGFIGGIINLIQFFVTRKDNNQEEREEIKKRLDKAERDSVRLQLLFLIKQFPESIQEIMKCAEHYFKTLHGDWYMTSIFNTWLVSNEIAKPEWFDEND